MNNKNSSDKMPFPWLMVLVAIIAIAVQCIIAIAIYRSLGTWAERGTFGDMFGAVNCLFSGLVLAGVIYTIAIQRQELKLQRKELVLTRDELKRAAEAQEKQMTMRSIREVITEIDLKEIHAARNYVYTNHRIYAAVAGDPSQLNSVPEDAFEKATIVSNAFDRVGVFVIEGMIPEEVVIKNFGESLAKSWVALEPLIEALRKSKYSQTYEIFFENLAKKAIAEIGLERIKSILKAWE